MSSILLLFEPRINHKFTCKLSFNNFIRKRLIKVPQIEWKLNFSFAIITFPQKETSENKLENRTIVKFSLHFNAKTIFIDSTRIQCEYFSQENSVFVQLCSKREFTKVVPHFPGENTSYLARNGTGPHSVKSASAKYSDSFRKHGENCIM